MIAERTPTEEAGVLASADIGVAVAVDVGHADRRVLRRIVPAVVVEHEVGGDRRAEAVAARAPAAEAVFAFRADVASLVAVDVGEADRRVAAAVIPTARVAELGAVD